MAHQFTRQELYDLVWAEPMKTVSARFGLTDVGLAQACRRADIPLPERGYWAKLRAGKKVHQRPLPPRGLGMTDGVVVGATSYYGSHARQDDDEIVASDPQPPVFERDISEVEAEVRTGVGRVTVPNSLSKAHHHIAKLLDADEQRRINAIGKPFVWDKPLFDTPFERRRLRIINAIFTAVQRYGMKPTLSGKEARTLGVQVNDQFVSFSVDDSKADISAHPSYYEKPRKPSGRMKVVILSWRSSDHMRMSWEDVDDNPVEKAITDIVVELITAGERQYREAMEYSYEWTLQRKAKIIEDRRREKEEAERKERERQERLEKERVDGLLADAAALRKAQDIRAYVEEIKTLVETESPDLQEWATWALAQADRIDPVVSGRYRDAMNVAD